MRRNSRITSISILSLGILAVFLSACVFNDILPGTPTKTIPDTSKDWYTVYFTDPEASTASSYKGGPDEALATAIDQAQVSVDIAIYDLNLWSITNAAIKAHQRGITVRLVFESDNLDEPQIQSIKDAGIQILGDRREGLMHNKFTIIDRMEVWTGSMNYTTNDAYHNDNNLIRISSQRLALDYTKEFEEMFLDDMFGPDVVKNTPYPSVQVDNTQIEVLFSPDDGTAIRLLELIRDAQKSINFLAYSFTSDSLAEAILSRARMGVIVSGIFEESQVKLNNGSEYKRIQSAGLNVRLDGNPRNMHDKVLIIDEQIVVTGSYNFSRSAEESNDENTLIIHNADIAAQYLAEFNRIYNKGH